MLLWKTERKAVSMKVRILTGKICLFANEIEILPASKVWILVCFLVISHSNILCMSCFTMKAETKCVNVQCQ